MADSECEESNDIIEFYKKFVENPNDSLYITYLGYLENTISIYDKNKEHIPGFIALCNIVAFLKNKQYSKLYNLDTFAIHEENINNHYPDDSIIVKNSLSHFYDNDNLIILYNTLHNNATKLKTKIDIFLYYNGRLIKQNIFTFNLNFDKYEFFNRCTEENYNFLKCNSLFTIERHEKQNSTIIDIISSINEINQNFAKDKKGFLYVFWVPKKQKKIPLY